MSASREHGLTLLERAKGDSYVAATLAAHTGAPGWSVGFHAQQAVEKAIKAVLAHREIQYPFTHDILLLVELLGANGIQAPPNAEDLVLLTPFASAWRYDDPLQESASIDYDWVLERVEETVAWAEATMGKV
jgi:HEPN domain-containing protein